jgi:hypothetical protein
LDESDAVIDDGTGAPSIPTTSGERSAAPRKLRV